PALNPVQCGVLYLHTCSDDRLYALLFPVAPQEGLDRAEAVGTGQSLASKAYRRYGLCRRGIGEHSRRRLYLRAEASICLGYLCFPTLSRRSGADPEAGTDA